MIPLTRAIPERIRDGLRRCAVQIDFYLDMHTGRNGSKVETVSSFAHCDVASGLMFYRRFFFFFELPLPSFDNGCTDLNEDCCINTVDEKIPTAKI